MTLEPLVFWIMNLDMQKVVMNSYPIKFFFSLLVKLVGGGSVINGACPSSLLTAEFSVIWL